MCTSLHFSLSWHEKLNLTLVHLQFQCNQISIQRNAFDETFPSMKTSTSRTDTQTINIFLRFLWNRASALRSGRSAGMFRNTSILIDLCWLVLFVALRCTNKLHRKFPWEWRRCSACVTNSSVFIFVWCRLKMFLIATLSDGNKTYTLPLCFVSRNRRNFPSFPSRIAALASSQVFHYDH